MHTDATAREAAPEAATGSSVDRTLLAARMGEAVRMIERWTQRTLRRDSGTSLSRNETHLLGHLAAVPPQRIGDLAHRQGVDRSTMSVQIRSLAARGLVERLPDPTDRRATTVTLSAGGRAELEAFLRPAAEILEHVLADWSDEDVTRFDGHLARFAETLSATME